MLETFWPVLVFRLAIERKGRKERNCLAIKFGFITLKLTRLIVLGFDRNFYFEAWPTYNQQPGGLFLSGWLGISLPVQPCRGPLRS